MLFCLLGVQVTSTAQTISLSGTGQTTNVTTSSTNSLSISGTNNTINVTGAGTTITAFVVDLDASYSLSNKIVINAATVVGTAAYSSSSGLFIGNTVPRVTGNSVIVTNGGSLNLTPIDWNGSDNNGKSYLSGTNSSLIVTGSGSTFSNVPGRVFYMTYGDGEDNSLVVSNGASAYPWITSVGGFARTTNSNNPVVSARVLVTGTNSLLHGRDLTSGKNSGYEALYAEVVVSNGGTIQMTNNFVIGQSGLVDRQGLSPETLLVTGEGSRVETYNFRSAYADIVITNGGQVVVSNTADLNYRGAPGDSSMLITGTGSVFSNNGTLYMKAAGSFASSTDGDVTITVADGGKLQLGGILRMGTNNSNTATLNIGKFGENGMGGTVVSASDIYGESTNNVINFNQSNNMTFDAHIYSGPGITVNKLGTGTVTLIAGTNIAGVNSGIGIINVEQGAFIGDTRSLRGTITNDAAVIFDQSTNGTYEGLMSGSGTLVKTGSGTLTLSGANTHSGGTEVAAGALAGDTTSLQGAITNNSVVTFNQSINGTYAGVMSGSGALLKTGAATLTLAGSKTYSGGTEVAAGTLAGDTTSLQGAITNNAQINFVQSTNGTYSGVMSGSGSLVKQGANTLTLNGANTFSGTTTVSAGRLVVNGTNASSAVTVESGAELGGSGQVGTLSVSGMVAPGNSIGTLSSGSTVFQPGGTFEFEMYDWSGSAGTGWDLQAITGDLTLSNTAGNPFVIDLVSMSSTNTTGLSVNWNGNADWTNTFVTYSGSLLGETFAADLFSVSTNNFQNAVNGTFTVTNVSGGLALLYTTAFDPDAPYVWDAGSGDWSTDSDWVANLSPTNDALLNFTGATGTATNDNQVTSVGGVVFSNSTGSLTLDGDAFSVAGGGIENKSTNAHTINNNLSVAADMSITASSNALTIAGNITNAAAARQLTIDGSENTAVSGVISGAGLLVKDGAGTVTLSGANTYSGGTEVVAGALVGDTTSLQGAITNNATLNFAQSTNGTFDIGQISNSASAVVIKSGAGRLTLTGANDDAALRTEIQQGELRGTTGSLPDGTIINDGRVTYQQSWDGSSAASISGTGWLSKGAAGTVTLTGTNTYSGGTLVSGGRLTGDTASLQGTITNNAAVNFNQSTNGTYAGLMSGSGALVKSGSQTLTLSGAFSYTGTTTLEEGTLNVSGNGTLPGAITGPGNLVKSGSGTLAITGANTYSGGTLISGGMLAGDTTSLQGAISNNSVLNLDQSTNGTYAGVMSGNGALVKSGSGTTTLSGTNTYSGGTEVTAGGLAGDTASLQGTITNNASVNFNQSINGTYAGLMSGSGALVKSGSQTLTLSGANTYSGGTEVAAGALVGDTTSLQGAITNNAAVSFNQSTNGTYSGSMSGSGALVKTGSETLTLSGANNYSGGTEVAAGTLSGDTASLQGAITNNATLHFAQGTNGTYNGVMSGSGELLKTGSQTLTLSGTVTHAGTTSLDEGTLNVSGNGTLPGAITGPGNLVKSGSGTLAITGTNTYSGGTLVSGGMLTGDTTSLQGAITNNAQVNFSQGTNGTYDTGVMSGSGSLVKSGSATLTLSGSKTYGGGTLVSGGTLAGDTTALQGTITNNAAVSFNQSTNGTYSGAMSGSGSLAKSGAATLTLSGSKTYSGGTLVSGGMLTGDTTSLQGRITNNADVTFNQSTNGTYAGVMSGSGTLFKTGSGTTTLSGANSYSGGTLVSAGELVGTTTSLQGAITNTTTVTFNQSINGTYAGVMSGSGTLSKKGSGTATLTGTSTYTGGVDLNAGGLVLVDGAIRLGQGSFAATAIDYTIANNATLELRANSTRPGFFYLTGDGIFRKSGAGELNTYSASALFGLGSGSLIHVEEGTYRFGGAGIGDWSSNLADMQVDAGATFNGAATAILLDSLDGAGSVQIGGGITVGVDGGSGVFSGTIGNSIYGNAFTLTKVGAGTQTLSGASSYTGGTLVSAGRLSGNTASLQGAITNNAAVTFSQNTNGTYAGVVSGSGTLLKSGTGTTTFSGVSTYSGGTEVQQGTLKVEGSTDNSVVTATSGGTIGGSGSIGGLIVNSGGTLSPGSSPGTITVSGNATWNPGGNYNWQAYNLEGTAGAADGWDLTSISGTLDLSALSLGSTFAINLWTLSGISPDVNGPALNFDEDVPDRWLIATAAGGIVGGNVIDAWGRSDQFTVYTSARNGTAGFANALAPASSFYISLVGNNVYLNYAVPEPGTYAAAALLTALGGYVRWRRRRQA